MTRDELNQFEQVGGQLQSVYDEISALSKKSPTDGVNKFKLRLINKLLGDAARILGDGYQPFEEFSQFDEDELPQNSDVVFILAQYLQCFEKLRADNVTHLGGRGWCWVIEDRDAPDANELGIVHVRTVTPRRLRE
jgi:hypothetical protein